MADLKLEKVPVTMWAWRKHRGNPKPVCDYYFELKTMVPNTTESYEQVPVPALPSNGILCRILASGGTSNCLSDLSQVLIDVQSAEVTIRY
jgi:propanol-preferring alcohol dehydrogenase